MEEKYYTVGEILRLGLLKNRAGAPYRHKATILNIIRREMEYTRVTTFWGSGYAVRESAIDQYNRRQK